MSLISKLPQIIVDGRKQWQNAQIPSDFEIDRYDNYDGIRKHSSLDSPCLDASGLNKLIQGDNLAICKYLSEAGYANRIKMIYIDPPFFSKADYNVNLKLKIDNKKTVPIIKQKAYTDSWENGMVEYLTMLASRLFAFRELLSDEGSIWVHLDWHGAHYVKILMDEIFGEENFINEIIWNYKSGGSTKKRFSRKHDTILFYSKTSDYYFEPQQEKSYNRKFKPYRFKGVKEYKDDKGWYTLVNMKDVWQIDMVGRTSAERTGYATQKPEALLSRIIESSTKEGHICADFFGGSGTMAAAAEKMGRRWISCDIGNLSTVNTLKRMTDAGSAFELIKAKSDVRSEVPITSDDVGVDGGIDVDVFVQNVQSSDSAHLIVKLTGYTLENNFEIPVDKKNRQLIDKILQTDWLQLIDYFAVDFDYDGKVFRPSVYASKEGDYITPQLETLSHTTGTMAVKAIDIFGNPSMKII